MTFLKTLVSLWEKMHDRITKVNIFADKNNLELNPGLHILATKA